MGKRAARDLDFTLNSVALEGYIDNFGLDVKPETPTVTTFADDGPRRVPCNYDWSEQLSGPNDFASGGLDATLFALLGNAGVAQTLETTGSAAGASTPTYTGTVLLGSYGLKWAMGQGAQYSAGLVGGSALTRNVS